MYDYEDSDGSDYSFEDSDYEYNSLEPYHYEHSAAKFEVIETPKDKLLKFIQSNNLPEVQAIIPSLLNMTNLSTTQQNDAKDDNVNGICENGDAISDDNSINEISDEDEEENSSCNILTHNKYEEIILKNGDTPLMVAAMEGNYEIVAYLLSLKLNVNYRLPNSNKTALLALFCKGNSGTWGTDKNSETVGELVKCLQLIIDSGGFVRAKGYLSTLEYGHTALHYAAQYDYWEMIEILINSGADIDSVNDQKLTPLHVAATKGHVACCNFLLIAGANAKLIDKYGNTSADLAWNEGFIQLSDTINVYSGNAQHNVRLYKTWSQYSPKFLTSDHDTSFTDIGDNLILSHSSIESFSLALNAPYLAKLMKDQGISISDLKLMDESKLKELGVPEKDSKNIIIAMKDLNKKPLSVSKKINFSYGRPLKPITMLEMIGNIGEHSEFIDTNLESMSYHLERNEKYYLEKYRIVNKSTVDNLKSNSQKCIDFTRQVEKRAEYLIYFINQLQNRKSEDIETEIMKPEWKNDQNREKIRKNKVNLKKSLLVTSVLIVTLSTAIFVRKYL